MNPFPVSLPVRVRTADESVVAPVTASVFLVAASVRKTADAAKKAIAATIILVFIFCIFFSRCKSSLTLIVRQSPNIVIFVNPYQYLF